MIKDFTLLCFISWIACPAIAQTGTIKGRVINSSSSEPLPFASVYINHTTLGTSAKENGDFVLRNIPFGEHELVVTFVGHKFFQKKINIRDTVTKSFTIRLASNPLREIQISSERDRRWGRQYERFKKLFLGTSIHASRCKILNPWVLDFGSENGFFIATASDVLVIENNSLGYKLFYLLKKFSFGATDYTISGNVRFELLQPTDSTITNEWKKNRQEVYLGSDRHLFKAILDSSLVEEAFEIYKDETRIRNIVRLSHFEANIGQEISNYSVENIPVEEVMPNKFKIPLPSRLEVHYLNRFESNEIYRNVDYPVSWIEVKGGYLIVNDQGIVLNPSRLVLAGKMYKARIAELVPYDFQPAKSIFSQTNVATKPKNKVNSLNYLLERPYLHTDKSYYYPNEMLWLRAYLNYAFPVFSDSLSKVLYVDLMDKYDHVVLRKILPIAQRSATGNLLIPRGLKGGDYVLRAYTRWMLNFDPSLMFSKPIKILEYSEIAKPLPDYKPFDSTNSVTIILQKDTFLTRERLTLRLAVKDFVQNFVPANFSISVTDLNQAVPAANDGSILNDYPLPEFSLPEFLSTDKFPIQYGIDFKGKVTTKKGKPMQGTLTVKQENNTENFTITTEENGQFAFYNLLLYDSAKLLGFVKTIKGLSGKVVMDSTDLSPVYQPVEPLKIEVYKSENPSRNNTWDNFSNAKLLREIVIEDTRLEQLDKSVSITSADYSISGDWLRDNNTTDLTIALQSKVPGLRFIAGRIVFGGTGTFGSAEPLVLIDGIAVNVNGDQGGFMTESVADRIANLNAQEIEKIEVLKYSSGSGYGSRGGNGVIAITTRKIDKGSQSSFIDKRKFQEITIAGFSAEDNFSSPAYDKPNDDQLRPDYRSTIYWNPYVQTDGVNVAEISFYAADTPTQYRIVVEGITRDRTIVHGEKIVVISARP